MYIWTTGQQIVIYPQNTQDFWCDPSWGQISKRFQKVDITLWGWCIFPFSMSLQPPPPSLIMHTVTSACCVSTWSWCAAPDIFCQSFATPPTLQDGAHGSILSQVCVAFIKPRRPRLDSSLATLLSFFFFIINQWHTVDDLTWIWGQTDLCVLIFYNITWAQILADLQSVPNCDLRELDEC